VTLCAIRFVDPSRPLASSCDCFGTIPIPATAASNPSCCKNKNQSAFGTTNEESCLACCAATVSTCYSNGEELGLHEKWKAECRAACRTGGIPPYSPTEAEPVPGGVVPDLLSIGEHPIFTDPSSHPPACRWDFFS
jgi:hypothetical protein